MASNCAPKRKGNLPPSRNLPRSSAYFALPSAAASRFLVVTLNEQPIPAYTLIDQPAQLAPLLAALDRVDEVALDTEADNMFHYRTRVCLLQFLVAGEIFLVDVLAPLPLAPLWEKLATKHLLMHGSDFDLRLLSDLCQFRPKSIFDTMLAAQLLNRQRIGLAALLEQHFGLILDKEGQKANWSNRPITKKLLDYAALDVWHLPALRDILTRELAQLDRLDWLDQQCGRQIESGMIGFPRDDENDWRIGRSERLRGRGLGVLHSVWHWREECARTLDVPPFKVCSADLLLDIAYAAEDGDSIEGILGKVNLGKRHARLVQSLATALREGFGRDPNTLPRRRRSETAPLSPQEIALQDRIKADRDRIAATLGLEGTLIANRSQLALIARDPAKVDDILLPWQADLLRSQPSMQPA
ncbi:ribonuclease D [Rariglobus hedericola]|uniref:3'-5' exonuclease n=1 Tax=Rariglobus hedericola TaxID=2597822 RepID=A0A556QSQ3_9BACT|nr:ribonuclease D [Rariglobus hedericola]TSJ79677.1 3'-5' exonuclease [Rariglobus hedericola]